MSSIRNDLILITLTGSVFLIVFTSLAVDYFISRRLEIEFDNNLTHKAGALMMLASQKDNIIEFDFADELMPEYERAYNPEYFQLAYYDSRLLEKSHSLQTERLPDITPKGEELIFRNVNLNNGRSIRMLTLGFTPRNPNEDKQTDIQQAKTLKKLRLHDNPGKINLILSVGVGREKIDDLVEDIHLYVVMSAICFISLVFLLLRFAIKRSLGPLREISTQVASMDMTNLGEKLSPSRNVEEIAPLVNQLNNLLARLNKSFQREQRFSSDVSHELRTPMAELRSIADVGSYYTDDKAVLTEYFSDLKAISQQMESIISNLMTISRFDSDHEKIVVEIVELDKLLLNVVEQPQPRTATKKIHLNGNNNIKIRCDEIKLILILNNLVSNAVAHGDASSDINIWTHSNEKFVEIRVENKASALSHEDIEHLFERFWRKDSARTSSQHAGLGLALVKAITDLLGIEVQAHLDGNNTLSIHLGKILRAR